MLACERAYSYNEGTFKAKNGEGAKIKKVVGVLRVIRYQHRVAGGSRCGSNHVVTLTVRREAECATSTLNHPIFFGASQPIARS